MADTFPELTITLADYRPHKRNYNRHPASQIERLRASLRKFGQPRNIVVWRNFFVAGHGVAQAAMAEGWTTLRANAIPSDWPEERVLAFLAADNELSRLSDPDQAALAALIDEAKQFDPELLTAIGYDAGEFDRLLKEVGQTTTTTPGDAPPKIDRAAELLAKWQVQPGELWRIGDHRLICGDCTDGATVARVMGGEKAQSIVTDPPYAFGLASTSKLANKSGGWHDMMNNATWFTSLYRQWQAMIDDGALWVFTNWRTLPILMSASFDSGVNMDSVGVWYKDWIGPGGLKGLRPTYELIAFSALGAYAIPDRGVEDFFKFGWSSHKPTGHNAEKPVELIARLIEITQRDLWFEPFAGSGTTIVACQNLQRKARAIEISPAYCSVILERMATAFPGIQIERL